MMRHVSTVCPGHWDHEMTDEELPVKPLVPGIEEEVVRLNASRYTEWRLNSKDGNGK
jgi:hypothetical protein